MKIQLFQSINNLNYEIISSLIIYSNYQSFGIKQIECLTSQLRAYFPNYELITSDQFRFSPLDYLIYDQQCPERHDHYFSKLYDTDIYPIYHNIINVIPKNPNLNNILQIKFSHQYSTHFEISCNQSDSLKYYANQIERIFSKALNPIINLYTIHHMEFDFKNSQKRRLALIELNQMINDQIKQFESKLLIYLSPQLNNLMNQLIQQDKIVELIKMIRK